MTLNSLVALLERTWFVTQKIIFLRDLYIGIYQKRFTNFLTNALTGLILVIFFSSPVKL